MPACGFNVPQSAARRAGSRDMGGMGDVRMMTGRQPAIRPALRAARCAVFLPLLAAGAALADGPAAYGHPDYYPTSERPAGLQGDGSGHFPGASPVAEWDFRTGRNIVWRCRLPGWGYSSPILVGDRVFVTVDWSKLICVDARTGKILWARDNETFDLVGGDRADHLRKIWDQETGRWLEAWACCWELAYLTWKLDWIEAAKAGKPLHWRRTGFGQGKSDGRCMAADHLTPEETKQVAAKLAALSDEEVEQLRRRRAALADERQAKQWGPSVNAYVPTLCPYVRGSENERAFKGKDGESRYRELAPHGIFVDFWNGWMGTSFPTPVSDGRYVYAMFSQCQVACYDLDGRRIWIRAFTDEAVTPRLDQNYSASPILADDKLIVTFGGREVRRGGGGAWTMLRALDKGTGALIWQRKTSFLASSHSFPQVRRVLHGGVDAIASGAGTIVRTADGEPVIENLPSPIAPPLVHENEVYYLCGAGEASGGGGRLKVVLTGNARAVQAKVTWAYFPEAHKGVRWYDHVARCFPEAKLTEMEAYTIRTNVCGIFHDGKVLYGSDPTMMIRPDTGESVGAPRGSRRIEGGECRGHLVRAGDVIVGTCRGTVVRVHDLKDPTKVVAVNHLGSEWQRQVQMLNLSAEEMVRAIRELPYMPNYADWAMMQSTPWPQGDRLYIRTRDTLYCIGDRAKPYHCPKGAPPAARTR